MDKNELRKRRCELEKQVESARTKRTIKTILAFSVAYFIVFCLDEKPVGLEILGVLVSSIVAAGIHFWVNAMVFGALFRRGEDERKMLEDIDKQLS